MSSPFQKNFSAKSPISMSPLNGAYENAADNPVYVSQAPAFADFQNQMTKISTDAFNEVGEDKGIEKQKADYKRIGVDASGYEKGDVGFDKKTAYTKEDYNIDHGYRQSGTGSDCPKGHHWNGAECKKNVSS